MPAGLPHGSTVPAPDGQTNTLWLPHAPGRRGSDVYPPGFLCAEGCRVRDYRANHITIKISAKRKDVQIPAAVNGTEEPSFSVALTFTAHSTDPSQRLIRPEGRSGKQDNPYPQGSYSLAGHREGDSIIYCSSQDAFENKRVCD